MAINATKNYLRHATSVLITAEKKMKDTKKKFKDEWYWDGHLISTKNDYVSTQAETVCSTSKDSNE